ncbi:MAG: rRNA adenine N-6-methyltransferase family protein [Chthoniobacterales bacterium]
MRFFKEILRAPHITGAIAPSSPFLANVVIDHAAVAEADRILELGPGTGVMTRRILEKKKADARFVAIEKNENFVPGLRQSFPAATVVPGDASELRRHATELEVAPADSIVSGLPWAIFPLDLQRMILAEIHGTLADDGTFVTFAYWGTHWLPAGQSFRQLLKSQFPVVRTSQVVLANFPPAFVYYCRKA